MKKLILSIAVLSITMAYAQKKEISSAYKAVESGDVATINSQIAAADAILNGKMYLIEPELQEQYYYAKGMALLKSGKTADAASVLSKIYDLKNNKIYTGKDANKNRVYYVGKAAADASGIANLKEEDYSLKTAENIGKAINPFIDATNKEAINAYNNKQYDIAGHKFVELYDLLKAGGQNERRFLYNAGISYILANNNQNALPLFQDLINSGFTGVETTYTAVNKKSGKPESLDKNTWELFKKMGASADYSDFKSETSPSIEAEIYERTAALLIETGKADEAVALIEKAEKKFPNNKTLADLKGSAYYKSGKTDQFVTTLREKLTKDPNDKESWYNLGVLLCKNPATLQEGIEAYKKAVAIDPNYAVAYQNLAFILMGDDAKAVDDINAARKAGKTELFNKLLQERRDRFAAALPYAEKWYAADPKNIDAVTLLKGLYTTTKNEAKAAEFKAKEAEMSKK